MNQPAIMPAFSSSTWTLPCVRIPSVTMALLLLCTLGTFTSATAATDNATTSNITYVSGTCKKVTADFNMSSYYNQEQMLINTFGGLDISGSQWDLGRDGAYVGYNVLFCGQYTPAASFFTLIQQKGFTITRTCNLASTLSYPAFHVFMLFDYMDGAELVLNNADVLAVRTFYMSGGGMYMFTDNCPYFQNANLVYRGMPSPIKEFQMQYNNNIVPYPLYNGNPVDDNRFGHHPTFTGIAEMSSGHSLSIPYYDSLFGIGVFAPMCTVAINRNPIACAGEPASSFVYSHASVMYVDPPVQLVNYTEACNWGRIVHDTGFTRYYNEPTRTGSHRLAANVVVWLLNIERVLERQASGIPLNSTDSANCLATVNTSTVSNDDVNKTQVLGCSNGDAVTLKSPAMMCRVGFSGSGDSAPACLALVVTETQGTTCVVDIQNAKIGTYWIMVDGKNSSLQFSVTAASLTPRGTIVAVTGACVKLSDTSASGCKDGSSITIDWTLPYPKELTLGLGSTVSICKTFVTSGTRVYCELQGLNKLPKGRYQTYINGVATGIPLTIQTDIPSLNKVLCSGSHTISPQASHDVTFTKTLLATKTPTTTWTLLPSKTRSLWMSITTTHTLTVSVSPLSITAHATHTLTTTETENTSKTVVVSGSRTSVKSDTWQLRETRTTTVTQSGPSKSFNATTTETIPLTLTLPVSGTKEWHSTTLTVRPTSSKTWECVNATALAAAFVPYVMAQLREATTDATIRNGTMITVSLPPLSSDVEPAALHAPWFERWDARASIRVIRCPNQQGFLNTNHRDVPVAISFPYGVKPNTGGGIAVIIIPPLPSYVIYADETIALDVRLGDLTMGALCGNRDGDSSTTTTLELARLSVTATIDDLFVNAQNAATNIVAAMSVVNPFAAPDAQALVIVAMMPCSNSYQKRTFAMFRVLSVFTLDDSFEGVLWGNLIANIAGFALHVLTVGVLSAVTRIDLAKATTMARFPSVYLQLLWQLTYASNAFAAVQLLSDSDTTPEIRALAAGMLLVFCVLMPLGLFLYTTYRVEAAYYVYQFHKWRRSETNVRVRLLSTVLLPIGRWEPKELRRRLGPFVALQSRPERIWMLLPIASPICLALFSLIRNQPDDTCVFVFVALALLHVALLVLIIVFCPLRSMIEDWFAGGGYTITTLFLCFTAINLAYPASRGVETILGVLAVMQLVLLLVRLLYHWAHIFIARRLSEYVPNVLYFEWYYGRVRVEDDVNLDECRSRGGAGGAEVSREKSLQAELSDLMMENAHGDDDLELEFLRKDSNDDNKDNLLLRPLVANSNGINEPDQDDLLMYGLSSSNNRKLGDQRMNDDDFADLLNGMQ